MANFDVAQADLSDAVTFLEQFLVSSLPQFDFSVGTSNRDIAINSVAYITAFFRKEIADIRNRQSLLTLAEASGDLDEDSVDELVNEILSDWFLNRKTGDKSRGFVTLRFSNKQIGVLTFTSGDVFARSGNEYQIFGSTIVIQSSDLVRNTDNLGIEYFTTTLELQATEVGEDYDITPGPFDEYPQVSPHLVSVENIETFSGGKSKETSSEMITRSESAITVRDLNIHPSVKTVLTDEFSQVKEVSPIGYGDVEMQRDRIDVPRGNNTVTIHRGSMYDAYVKFPVEFTKLYTDAVPSSGGLQVQTYIVNDVAIIAVKLPSFPIYRIKRLINKNVSPAVDVAFTVVSPEPFTWNSNRQEIYLQVSSALSGLFLDLEYDTVTGYAAVQEYLENTSQRIMVADPLAKAAFGLYLSFEIRYYSSGIGLDDTEAAKDTMQLFIESQLIGQEFRVSDITCHFRDTFVGTSPQSPFVVVGELLMPNGKILSMTFDDRIRAPDRYYYDETTPTVLVPLFAGDEEPGDKVVVVLTDLQVSTKTLRYITDTADIELTFVTT